MTFGNLLLSPSDQLNDLFEKNPNGVEIQSILDILSKKKDEVVNRIKELHIGTITVGKRGKNYYYISPEGVELLVQSFSTIDKTKEQVNNTLNTTESEQESRMTCAKAMEKYDISRNEWIELVQLQNKLFKSFLYNRKNLYYVPEEDIPAFLQAIADKRKLRSKPKKIF